MVEETRPGEYMPVYENDRGTFIFNSKDLCMIEHVPEMIEAGSRYARMEGMEDAGTLTLDELLDTMGLDDFQSAFAAVTQTTKDGLTPHVEVEPAKNAKTTPEK